MGIDKMKMVDRIAWVIMILIILFSLFSGSSWFSSFEPHHLLRKYSPEEIDHFARFAFQTGEIEKWRDDIRVKIAAYGSKPEFASKISQSCVSILDSLMEEIGIRMVDEDHNLSIEFLGKLADEKLGVTT